MVARRRNANRQAQETVECADDELREIAELIQNCERRLVNERMSVSDRKKLWNEIIKGYLLRDYYVRWSKAPTPGSREHTLMREHARFVLHRFYVPRKKTKADRDKEIIRLWNDDVRMNVLIKRIQKDWPETTGDAIRFVIKKAQKTGAAKRRR
jgi:hypothetical protein